MSYNDKQEAKQMLRQHGCQLSRFLTRFHALLLAI